MKYTRQNGFTLIELVMVIVLLGIAAVAIVGGYGTVARSLGENQDIQTAVQLAQACGEYVLAARRDNPAIQYTGVKGANFCSSVLGTFQSFNINLSYTDPYTGSGCPGKCKLVTINVVKGTDTLATSNLMLVNY
ncbi:MAG: type II secretion system protein [Acidiferrobacterales bacterium]